MDKYNTIRREAFFNNLLLLGLDKTFYERKYGVPLNKDMFIVPNKKGYEVITYFLFSKLSATTGKDYKLPWPLGCIENDRLFQKTSYSHLSSFSQENEVKFPLIVPSLLSLFGGDRFYKLYLAFSSYVLKKVIQKNANVNLSSRPNVTRENFNTVKDIVQLSTICQQEKFINILAASHQNDLIWKKYAKNLSECLQKLKHILKMNKELMRSKESILIRLNFMVPGEILKLEELVEKSLLLGKQIRRQRKYLEQFFITEENSWQYLVSEVDGNTETSILSAKDIKSDIAIIEKLSNGSEKVVISPEEDRKISVIRYLNCVLACVKPITDLLKANMCNIPETSLLNDEFTLKHNLSSIQEIIDKLSKDIIPSLEDDIKKLEVYHGFENSEEILESILSDICSLPNVSYNPEAVKTRALLVDPELEEKLQMSISKEIANNSIFSAHLSVSQRSSETSQSVLNMTSHHGLQLSEMVDFADATFIRKVALINSFRPKLVGEAEKSTNASSSKQNEVPAKNQPSASRNILELSDLDDLDFAPSTHFKMRDSWLNVESLHAETLPDISFEE